MILATRKMFPLSYTPANLDAMFVLEMLEHAPPRMRSALIWQWAAAGIRGESVEPLVRPCHDDDEDDIDAALDSF